jgi:hypothetical protein
VNLKVNDEMVGGVDTIRYSDHDVVDVNTIIFIARVVGLSKVFKVMT